MRTVPTFSVDPAWPVNGAAVSTAPGGQDISTGGGERVADDQGPAVGIWELM